MDIPKTITASQHTMVVDRHHRQQNACVSSTTTGDGSGSNIGGVDGSGRQARTTPTFTPCGTATALNANGMGSRSSSVPAAGTAAFQRRWMARVLMCVSAAQQIGASATSLVVLKTFAWNGAELASFWMTLGVVLWFAPLLGWLSDRWSVSPAVPSSAAVALSGTERRREDPDVASGGASGDDGDRLAAAAVVGRGGRCDSSVAARRRLRLLQAAAVCCVASFGILWCAVAAATPPPPSSSSAKEDDASLPWWQRLAVGRTSTHVIVSASVVLAVVQLFQTATINGWLVQFSHQGSSSDCEDDNTDVVATGDDHNNGSIPSPSLATPSDALASVQSWAMLQRSIGSLCGSIAETTLLATHVVTTPAHLILLLCIPLQLGCVVFVAHVLTTERSTTSAAHLSSSRPSAMVVPSFHRRDEGGGGDGGSCAADDGGGGRRRWLPWTWSWVGRSWLRQRCHLANALWLPLCFVLLYSSMPSPAAAYFAFVAQQLAYPSWLLAMNGTVGLLGSTIAVLVFDRSWRRSSSCSGGRTVAVTPVVDECQVDGVTESRRRDHKHNNNNATPLQYSDDEEGRTGLHRGGCGDEAHLFGPQLLRAFLTAAVVGILGTLSNLVLVRWGGSGSGCMGTTLSQLYLLVDEAVVAFAQRWVYMPILVLAANAAAPGVEALVFEVFAATSSVGGVLGGAVSVLLMRVTATMREAGDDGGAAAGGGASNGAIVVSLSRSARDPLTLLIVVCAAWKLLPVLMVACLILRRRLSLQ